MTKELEFKINITVEDIDESEILETFEDLHNKLNMLGCGKIVNVTSVYWCAFLRVKIDSHTLEKLSELFNYLNNTFTGIETPEVTIIEEEYNKPYWRTSGLTPELSIIWS